MFERFRKRPQSDKAVKTRLIESGALPKEPGRMGDLAVKAYRSKDDVGQESGMPGDVVGAWDNTHVPDLTTTEDGQAVLARLDQMTEAGVRAYGAGLRGEDVLRAMEAEARQSRAEFPAEL